MEGFHHVSITFLRVRRVRGKQANLPLSQYMAQLIKRETGAQNQWPAGYFDLFHALGWAMHNQDLLN